METHLNACTNEFYRLYFKAPGIRRDIAKMVDDAPTDHFAPRDVYGLVGGSLDAINLLDKDIDALLAERDLEHIGAHLDSCAARKSGMAQYPHCI